MTPLPSDRTPMLACFYGLMLRTRGYPAAEAAKLVSERYPSMAARLRSLAGRPQPVVEAAIKEERHE